MSADQRDPVAWAALALAGVAFLGSFDHVRSVVASHGQTGWLSWAIAAMPEAMVALAVIKIRQGVRGRAAAWTWIVGASAATFTVAANLATAEPSPWGFVAAGWPAWAAIGAAGLVELGEASDATEASPVEPTPAALVQVTDGATAAETTPLEPPASAESLPRAAPDLEALALAVAGEIAASGQRLTRRALGDALRAHGATVSTDRCSQILKHIKTGAPS